MEPNVKNQRVLHNYFRSSSSHRVRIAMNLKGLSYDYVSVHLNRNGGEQFQPAFKSLNPQGLVPVLDDNGVAVSQSLAIFEYLDEKYPQVPLLPAAAEDRAFVRQIALSIACDISPLNNLRVLKFLTGPMGLSEESKNAWLQHWLTVGLSALESELSQSGKSGKFCFGDTPTIADCCLVPQLFSARRFAIDTKEYPTLAAIDAECDKLPAFQQAHPQNQPDTE